MVTNAHPRQQGFILVTLIFLLLVGGLLLAAMAYLYGTSNTEQGIQNSGAQALIASESGDQYGVYWLDTQYVRNYPAVPLLVPAQSPMPNSACPAAVKVTSSPLGGGYYTVTSIARCGSPQAQWTVVRTVQARGKQPKFKKNKLKKAGKLYYQVVEWVEQ